MVKGGFDYYILWGPCKYKLKNRERRKDRLHKLAFFSLEHKLSKDKFIYLYNWILSIEIKDYSMKETNLILQWTFFADAYGFMKNQEQNPCNE